MYSIIFFEIACYYLSHFYSIGHGTDYKITCVISVFFGH